MKISTTTNIYYSRPDRRPRTYVESIEKIARAGFDCVDFQFNNLLINPKNELRGSDWEAELEKISLALEANGVTASQAHAPFPEFFDPDYTDSELALAMTRRAIDAAGRLGIKWIVCHPCTIFGEPRTEKIFNANAEHFKPLLEQASKYDMGIAFENIFDKFMLTTGAKRKHGTLLAERSVDARFRTARYFANWPEELAEFCDRMGAYGKTGCCWDTGHGNEMMVDQAASLEIIGDRLKALHLNDNFGMQDVHLMPFFGEIDWMPILSALKKIGYTGEITLETGMFMKNIPEELVEQGLKYCADIARFMANKVELI